MNTAFAKANAAGDVDGVVNLFSDDAVLSPPGTPALRGGLAIRDYWSQEIPAAAAAGVTLAFATDSDVSVVGDLGWESGSVTISDKSGTVMDRAKYLTIFRRGADGGWLMLRDIYNSDRAPAPATPEAPTG